MQYKCLVLDHDDTVVQSEKTLSYPHFCETLRQLRPGKQISLQDYVQDCHSMGFVKMCQQRFGFTDEELAAEHDEWTHYIRQHIPDPFPGIERIIRRQKDAGGLICVASHSAKDTITRDYLAHFGTEPDAVYGWELPEQQRKPSPYALENIMERYALKPEEILVVDDVKLACMMAQPVGVDVAFAAWSKADFPELTVEMRQLCKYAFDSTKELEKFLFD